jgi:hypothetical protein
MDNAALSEAIQRVVDSAEQTLRRVSSEESAKPVLPGGWSRRQLIGHLIDSASNNHQRFIRAALQDSVEFPAYDQNEWSRIQAPDEADWPLLVTLWVNYNRYLAHVIARLPPAKHEVVLYIGTNPPMTLGAIAEDYLRHMMHHLGQIGAVSDAT